MRFLGPTKDMRFQEGKHKNGSIEAHEVLGPSNEIMFKILSQICLSPSIITVQRVATGGLVRLGMVRSINAHQNLLMVITVQRAATGAGGQ